MLQIIIRNLFYVLFIILFYKKTKHGLHMLQLESYKNERYFKWLKQNIKGTFFLIPDKKEKKPFVVTNRVKRMYCTYLIILLIIVILGNIFTKYEWSIVVCLVSFVFSYYIVPCINKINSPIEKHIQKGFYNKAKKKLNEMPSLTGSYGKTSTKYAVTTILSQKYNVLMTPESYNTTMGVVRTINEKLNSMHNIFVCEMGAKQIGDIKEICDLVKPNFGVLTAIGPQHLETFKTIDNVKKTKLELVDSLNEDGIAFVNYDDDIISKTQINKNKITYGMRKDLDYYADEITCNEKGSNFVVHCKTGKSIQVKTKLLGKHNISNIVGAIAVADTLGLSEEEIIAGVRFLKPVPHRLELIGKPDGSLVIDDAYNSNSQGAKRALEVLGSFEGRKKILVTPGIVDLGEDAEKYNEMLGEQASEVADYIILVGEKQAEPILKGILKKSYSREKVYIAKDLNDAIGKMQELTDNNTVTLLENDLPDNYL